MKKTYCLIVVLCQLALAGNIMSQEGITLTFSAYTDTLHQPLDSVVIRSVSQGEMVVLHYPDTVLVLGSDTDVFEPHNRQDGGLILYPPYPNPFTDQTTLRLFVPERDEVAIQVFDVKGREVTAYQQVLPRGQHTFTLNSGREQYYILVVTTSHHKRSQKLINLSGGSSFRLAHTGYQPGSKGHRKGMLEFPWAPGDQLEFTGYATLEGNIVVSDARFDDPSTSQFYTFQFTAPPPPVYPSGYVHCDPTNPTPAVEVINPLTGEVWMDRNLGAARAATKSNDTAAFGDLYQWGRFADGHQCRNSQTTSVISSTDQPPYSNFILVSTMPFDWRHPQNNSLWQGTTGTNNPCPQGYRLPTEAEWEAERQSWSSNNAAGAIASPLKLTMAGYRDPANGDLSDLGSSGGYYSSSDDGGFVKFLGFNAHNASLSSFGRAVGYTVRCIKN